MVSKKGLSGRPSMEPMKALSLLQPRASLVLRRLQGIIVYTDDSVRSLLKERERIVIHAPSGFDQVDFDIVQEHLVGPVTRDKYSKMVSGDFPKNMVLCTTVVSSMRWLRDWNRGGCLCNPEGMFGVILMDIEPFLPPVYCEREVASGEIWDWDPVAEDSDGQAWLF